ncbi:MAG: PIG-L family deacetylase [Polyangiaceae bacterium]|nr:PIG-L family deacetylase [Polyangiaceae bacterium]
MNRARHIEGSGTAPASWERWLRRNVACRPLDAWVAADARLVVVAPHPDDEVLGCGGLLAMHCERGGEALVVGATDGEASHGATENPHRLAATRARERRTGLRALSYIGPVIRFGLPDGGVRGVEATLARRLEALLHPGDVVACTWRLDGHPDHEAVGQCVRRACRERALRCLEAPVWMWHWASPPAPASSAEDAPWAHLAGLELDERARARKARALAAHRSQLTARSTSSGAVLGPEIRARAAWSCEYFFSDEA